METRIYDIALKEKDEDRERNFEKIEKLIKELKEKKEKNEISDEEYDKILSKEIKDYLEYTEKIIPKISGTPWNFNEEKNRKYLHLTIV